MFEQLLLNIYNIESILCMPAFLLVLSYNHKGISIKRIEKRLF